MAVALLRLDLEIASSDGRCAEEIWAEVARGPGGSARWTLRAEAVAGGGRPGLPIVTHAFTWSGAALAEAGSLLHAGCREPIRILRAMLRPGLLSGISGRDEEIAKALRVWARHRDLHGTLDIAATAGIEVEGTAEAVRLDLPEAGWSVLLRPIGPEGEAAPEVDLRAERGVVPDPAFADGRHASGTVAAAVAALALELRALARLADGSEGDTALPAPAFVWPILDRIGGREVVVRAGEILEVLEESGHQGMAPARLETARRALEEGGCGLEHAAEAFAQMAAWASPRDERHVAYAAFARRLRALAAGEAEDALSTSGGAGR